MANQKFITVEGGVKKLKTSISTTSGTATDAGKIIATGSDGRLSNEFLPLGVGVDSITLPAFEIIPANSIVAVFNDAGTHKARLALANTTTGFSAIGYTVDGATAIGDNVVVYLEGSEYTITGGVVGQTYFLSDTTAGTVTKVCPTTSGTFIQTLGVIVDTDKLRFEQELGDIIYID